MGTHNKDISNGSDFLVNGQPSEMNREGKEDGSKAPFQSNGTEDVFFNDNQECTNKNKYRDGNWSKNVSKYDLDFRSMSSIKEADMIDASNLAQPPDGSGKLTRGNESMTNLFASENDPIAEEFFENYLEKKFIGRDFDSKSVISEKMWENSPSHFAMQMIMILRGLVDQKNNGISSSQDPSRVGFVQKAFEYPCSSQLSKPNEQKKVRAKTDRAKTESDSDEIGKKQSDKKETKQEHDYPIDSKKNNLKKRKGSYFSSKDAMVFERAFYNELFDAYLFPLLSEKEIKEKITIYTDDLTERKILWLSIQLYKASKDSLSSKDIIIRTPLDVYKLFYHLKFEKEEWIKVLLVNGQGKLLKCRSLSLGKENSARIEPYQLFQDSTLFQSRRMILLHNHPSGRIVPSVEDLRFTRKVQEISETLKVLLVDHVILGEGYYSMREKGLIESYKKINTTNQRLVPKFQTGVV